MPLASPRASVSMKFGYCPGCNDFEAADKQ